MYHLHTFSCTYFYSHPREGGDYVVWQICNVSTCISIHAPAKGATGISGQCFPVIYYFYSRPREGGDHNTTAGENPKHPISIHAPAKGATLLRYPYIRCCYISIHAPAKGAMKVANRHSRLIYIFLFTPPRRGRLSRHTCL